MAGESTAHLILFIATVILASSVSTVMIVTIQKMAVEIENQANILKDMLATDFIIINDPTLIPIKDSAYVFYVKNIGNSIIPFTNESLTVLIDGILVPKQNITTSPTVLKPGEVGEVLVTASLSSGDHRIVIILDNGLSSSFDFTI